MNKDPDKVTEEDPLIILDSKSDMCMANNGKDTNYTRHITRRVNLKRNGENYKIHKDCWCEGDMQSVEISTKNVGDNDLNSRMKYIMVRLDN